MSRTHGIQVHAARAWAAYETFRARNRATCQNRRLGFAGNGDGFRRPARENRPRSARLMTPAPVHFSDRQVSMWLYFLVASGGALGSVSRFFLSGVVANHFGGTFPWGTLIVNVTGSFAIGFFATLTAPEGRWLAGADTRQFFMTGICGGYTTFSSFSLQT